MNTGKGRTAFDEHYRQLFGDEYQDLVNCLSGDFYPVFLVRADKVDVLKNRWEAEGFSWQELPWMKGVIQWPENVSLGTVLPGVDEGWLYPLSPSSLLPVRALAIQPDDICFDACAAPGGKTIAVARQLKASPGAMTANDLSPARSIRLRKSVRQFGLTDRIDFTTGPAEIIARRRDGLFDKILIDAPCSSEGHVLGSATHMDQWSYKRIKVLRKRQMSLLTALLPKLTSTGRLVYATCALTPEENEQVIAEVLVQCGQQFELVKVDLTGCPGSEGMAGFGVDPTMVHRVWPTISNLEPMFVAVFERKHTVQ